MEEDYDQLLADLALQEEMEREAGEADLAEEARLRTPEGALDLIQKCQAVELRTWQEATARAIANGYDPDACGPRPLQPAGVLAVTTLERTYHRRESGMRLVATVRCDDGKDHTATYTEEYDPGSYDEPSSYGAGISWDGEDA